VDPFTFVWKLVPWTGIFSVDVCLYSTGYTSERYKIFRIATHVGMRRFVQVVLFDEQFGSAPAVAVSFAGADKFF